MQAPQSAGMHKNCIIVYNQHYCIQSHNCIHWCIVCKYLCISAYLHCGIRASSVAVGRGLGMPPAIRFLRFLRRFCVLRFLSLSAIKFYYRRYFCNVNQENAHRHPVALAVAVLPCTGKMQAGRESVPHRLGVLRSSQAPLWTAFLSHASKISCQISIFCLTRYYLRCYHGIT